MRVRHARELCRKVGIGRNQTSLGCSKFNLNLNIFNCSSPGKFILWIVLKSAPLVALIHLEPGLEIKKGKESHFMNYQIEGGEGRRGNLRSQERYPPFSWRKRLFESTFLRSTVNLGMASLRGGPFFKPIVIKDKVERISQMKFYPRLIVISYVSTSNDVYTLQVQVLQV